MKIGFFLPNATFDLPGSPEVGGIETFAFTVGEAMQKLGHEVILFGGKPKAGRRHRETTLDLRLFDYIETRSIPDLGTRFQRLAQRLHFGWKTRRAWLDERFDVAILAKPFDWPVAGWWKRRQPKMRVLMGFHGTDFFLGDRRFFKSVDQSFAVSSQVADLAYRRVGVLPTLVPNPVDLDFFSPRAHEAEGEARTLRLAASGRLVGWKGFAHLIDGIEATLHNGLDVRCGIAGEGPELRVLKQLVEEKSLESRVQFYGRLNREDLRELLWSADGYVAPSIGMEAFSIAAAEAAATGLPLLLSDKVGLRDFLGSQDYISYPAGDVTALAAGLEELSARRSLASWSNREIRHQRMQQLFAPEKVARKILALV